MPLVTLMLCCNHHRNGEFLGRCRALSLDLPRAGEVLYLESPYIDVALKCEIGERSFRLGKATTCLHFGHSTWVGNWCWDAVRVRPGGAAAVLNFALAKGYHVTLASEPLLWVGDDPRPLTAADIEAAVATNESE